MQIGGNKTVFLAHFPRATFPFFAKCPIPHFLLKTCPEPRQFFFTPNLKAAFANTRWRMWRKQKICPRPIPTFFFQPRVYVVSTSLRIFYPCIQALEAWSRGGAKGEEGEERQEDEEEEEEGGGKSARSEPNNLAPAFFSSKHYRGARGSKATFKSKSKHKLNCNQNRSPNLNPNLNPNAETNPNPNPCLNQSTNRTQIQIQKNSIPNLN